MGISKNLPLQHNKHLVTVDYCVSGSSSIDTLYLGDWDFSNGESFDYIFSNCKNLKDIYLSDTFPQLTEDMFQDCNPKLKIHWKDNIYTYQDLIEYSIFGN